MAFYDVTKDDGSYDSGADTMSPELPYRPLSTGTPDNFVDTPRTDGLGFGGVLKSVSATADSLINTWGKVVSLQSSVENAKFQRVLTSAQTDVMRSSALGDVAIKKATVDANLQIELAKASRGVNDFLAREASGAAGFVRQVTRIDPKIIIVAALLGAAYYFSKNKAL